MYAGYGEGFALFIHRQNEIAQWGSSQEFNPLFSTPFAITTQIAICPRIHSSGIKASAGHRKQGLYLLKVSVFFRTSW